MRDVIFKEGGREYTFSPGFGSQLTSYEKNPVPPGTMRWIFGRAFYIFLCHNRRVFAKNYECNWGLALWPDASLDDQHAAIASLRKHLESRI